MSGELLLQAARDGNIAGVLNLLDAGTPVNHKDANNQTALCFAASSGHYAIVNILLARGADHKIKANRGGIALDMARRNNRMECVAALEDHSSALRQLNPAQRERANFNNDQRDVKLAADDRVQAQLKPGARNRSDKIAHAQPEAAFVQEINSVEIMARPKKDKGEKNVDGNNSASDLDLKVASPPNLIRNISAESEAIVASFSARRERQDKVRETLFVIKKAHEEGRISVLEKGILKDQLSDERPYSEEILLKLSREEERVLFSEIASRLKHYQDQMSKEINMLECAVCLCNYSVSGNLVPHHLPFCGHTFCIGCIRKLLSSSSRCPDCRRELPCNESDIHINYSLLAIIEQKVTLHTYFYIFHIFSC